MVCVMWGLDPMVGHLKRADRHDMNRAWTLIFIAASLYAAFQSIVIVKVVPAIWL